MRSKIIIEIICFLGIAFGVFCGYLTIYQINKRNREILRLLNKLELAQIGIDVKLAQVNIMGIIKKEEKLFMKVS